MKHWWVIIAFLLVACGGTVVKPDPIPFIETAEKALEETSAIPAIPVSYEQACLELDGRWDPLGKFDLGPNVTAHLGTHICNLSTSDAGQSCSSRFRCEGRCLLPDPKSDKGYCSSHWLPERDALLYPWIQGRGNPGEPPPIPDNLYAEKISRIKNYVLNRHLWSLKSPKNYSYEYHFDGGLAVSINPLPAVLTIHDGQVVSALYTGEGGLRPDGEPPIKTGDEIEWRSVNTLEFHFRELRRWISLKVIGDRLDVEYHPDFGHPVFVEADSARMSDSYLLVKFRDFKALDD